ncbi:Ubiquitin-conjugating enzyme E2 6 [Chytriomyces hyalinus]|nr:Ubiquitin-conjugating enzyme E2 6 [Chytriomyces hyalinus]KAJ3399229.1 Ubiquitin-conjugating enzyme E2 6 [Chytriomyces hyalinus]
MASKQATKRLQKEYQMMGSNPPEFIQAKPLDSNILVWHYVVTGPPDSPYEGGQYHGKVIFPEEYPFKPPAIKMLTPNGRFQTDTRLCLSMSDYHPGTWNPAWSVATILTGLLSFMLEETPTTGSIKTSVQERRQLSRRSRAWNRADKRFRDVWPELCEEELPVDTPETDQENTEASTLHRRKPASKAQANGAAVAPAGNAVLVKAVGGIWSRIKSNMLVLVLGGLMTYLVVLKVLSRLGL